MKHTTLVNKLEIMYINARSTRTKIEIIQILIEEHKEIDILIITDTWLSPEHEIYVNFAGYAIFFTRRDNKKGGGGVAVIIRERYKCSKITSERH